MTTCWKCADSDAAYQAKCTAPACGMRETAEPSVSPENADAEENVRLDAELQRCMKERDVLRTELAALRAAPSTSQPLTNIEVEALAICRRAGHVSVSQVQRILEISYNEAGEICQSIIDKGQCNELELAPSLTPLAAPGTLINGLTEAETDVSMSVRGLKPPTVSPCHPRQSDRKE